MFSFNITVGAETKAKLGFGRMLAKVIGLQPDQTAFHILVVEDQYDNRILLCKLLRSVGFMVHEAVNGKEAVDQYKRLKPDLIWMDIGMPIMDGLEATKLIRKLETQFAETEDSDIQSPVRGRIPILVLTAHVFEDEKAGILAAGCDDIISKPFQEAEIFDVMKRHLGVQYRYEHAERAGFGNDEEPSGDWLTAENLANLPNEDMLTELKQAVINLDVDLCQAVINRIRTVNVHIGDRMTKLAKEYQFENILAIVSQIHDFRSEGDKNEWS